MRGAGQASGSRRAPLPKIQTIARGGQQQIYVQTPSGNTTQMNAARVHPRATLL